MPDTRHKSARVPDGDDGDDGDDDEPDDEKHKGRGRHRSIPSSDEDTDTDPPEDCDRGSDYSSEGDSEVGDRDSDDANDTDFEDNSDCEIEPAKKKAKPKSEAALIQQNSVGANQDSHRQFVGKRVIGYIKGVLAKTGDNIDKDSKKMTDLTKNGVAHVFLDGGVTPINHKDHGNLTRERAEQAQKSQSGSTSGKKTSEAQELVLPKHSADLYQYDQTSYRKWIHMLGHTEFHLLLLTDRMVQKMQKSVQKPKYSKEDRKLVEGLP